MGDRHPMRIELCLATEDLIAIRGRGFTTRSIDHQYAVAAVHARIARVGFPVPLSQSHGNTIARQRTYGNVVFVSAWATG